MNVVWSISHLDFPGMLHTIKRLHIESIIMEKFGMRSLRIFRLISIKKNLEMQQVLFGFQSSSTCRWLIWRWCPWRKRGSVSTQCCMRMYVHFRLPPLLIRRFFTYKKSPRLWTTCLLRLFISSLCGRTNSTMSSGLTFIMVFSLQSCPRFNFSDLQHI